jgi:hypothetical protein
MSKNITANILILERRHFDLVPRVAAKFIAFALTWVSIRGPFFKLNLDSAVHLLKKST